MSIYTANGDKGTTNLVHTKNVSKSDDRIQLVGTIDELNSHLGLIKTMMSEADDIRFSCCYSTIVKQRKISKSEYEYYQEKIKINEEMGGLFIPQPSELPTNIICNNSGKNVVGYVGVSMNVAKYRIFISADDIYYRFPDGYCQEFRGWADSYMDLYVMGYAIAYPLMVGYAWVSGGCTDVRYLGASLEKPSFWPDEMN